MKIDILYFSGCPNSKPALELLKQIMREKDINVEISEIEIKSEEDAIKHNFLGSPSIHVNGKDIEPGRSNDPSFFGCRIYRYNGETSGIPSRELIEKALD